MPARSDPEPTWQKAEEALFAAIGRRCLNPLCRRKAPPRL
jgi:hypothetical protein